MKRILGAIFCVLVFACCAWAGVQDGGALPENPVFNSVTIGTTYRTVSVNGITRAIETLTSAGIVTRIDLYNDGAVLDNAGASTIGTIAWALTFAQSYSTGTVATTSGSATVTLTGGIWTQANAQPGFYINIANALYVIDSYTDSTHLVLNRKAATTVSSQAYNVGSALTVHVHGGTWPIGSTSEAYPSSTVSIPYTYTTLEGDGDATNIVLNGSATAGAAAIEILSGVTGINAQYPVCQNFLMTYNDPNANQIGVHYSAGSMHATSRNLHLQNFPAPSSGMYMGIDYSSSQYSQTIGCHFDNVVQPITFSGTVGNSDHLVNGCHFDNIPSLAGGGAIYGEYPYNMQITGNYFSTGGSSFSVYILGSYSNLGQINIVGNYFNGGSGVKLGPGTSGSYVYRANISGNIFNANSLILSSTNADISVIGNQFNNGTTTGGGTSIYANGTKYTISGNSFYDGQTGGVDINASGSYGVIMGNSHFNVATGVLINSGSTNIADINDVFHTVTTPISNAGTGTVLVPTSPTTF